MELVSSLEIEEIAEIELAGDYAFVNSSDEFSIVDISDPRRPFVESTANCEGAFGDVALNPPATIALLVTNYSGIGCSPDGKPGIGIFDVSDKKRPKLLTGMLLGTGGAHTATLDGHILYVNQYDPTYQKIEIFDLSDPARPQKLSEVALTPNGAHDSYVDQRPDGRVLLYAASIESYDVVDVTDPRRPVTLQKVCDNENNVTHQLEPNHSRTVLIGTEEYGGAAAPGGCGKAPTADATAPLGGHVTGAQATGVVHFYTMGADGTFDTLGLMKPGTFAVPFNPQVESCTSHVFWQAPDQDRSVIGWFAEGARVVDFSDPAHATELGHIVPEGANTWSAKPHNGFIYMTERVTNRLNVVRFTGEGWPANAGPAEVQRAQQQKSYRGAIGAPLPGAPAAAQPGERRLGRFRLAARLPRAPGRGGASRRLTLTVTDDDGVVVARAGFRRRAGRRVPVRASGVGVAGTYRYSVRLGERGKMLARGTATVEPAAGLALAPDRSLSVRVSR